jgi:Bacterial Ig domain/Divergent InlB B-repeat domain/Fibronectin type III domain
MSYRRWLTGLVLVVGAILVAPHAVMAGILDASWTAPTTNTDGTPLTDLASYRVYYGTLASPCLGGSFVQLAATTTTPPPNQTVTYRLTSLTPGTQYYVALTAVDSAGSESACSPTASAVAQVEIAVTPTATVNFGNINLGGSTTQTFTVQSTRSGTVTGTASVPAPFSIVSGSPFTLVGTGATATVTVRFAPTSTAAATTNVNFIANGDTVSRAVTGTGVSTGSTLTVSKAGAGTGTVTSSPAAISCGATCSASFTSGTMVTLTAAPLAGSTFTGWSGGGCAGTGTCTFTINASTSVTASFARQTIGDTTAPTVSITAPTASATVTGTVTVTATAIDNVGVAGVQFLLDGVRLGAEMATPPYGVAWNTTTSTNGAHVLTAVARDAAGNRATSTAVGVTVANIATSPVDVTLPVTSRVSLSVTSSGATIGWTTNEPSDTQVEYGLTTSYGRSAPLDTALVTSHSQTISGLAANTWYHFRMRSRDAAGNLGVSGDFKFKTRSH